MILDVDLIKGSTMYKYSQCFFGIESTGTSQGFKDSIIKPWFTSSPTCLLNSSVILGLIQLASVFGNIDLGIRLILWCHVISAPCEEKCLSLNINLIDHGVVLGNI